MYAKNPYAQYTNNNINTAPQEELTLMLYDGALKFTNQAILAIQSKDNEKTNELLIRVQDIYRELQITLDQKYEISKQLYIMYDYIIRRCIEANITKEIEVVEEVRELARDFRDTWKEAMKLAKIQSKSK